MMMWNKFAAAIQAQVAKDKVSLMSVERETGLSHARMHDAANGKPLGTESYLAVCKWLNVHPSKFWTGDIRDKQERVA